MTQQLPPDIIVIGGVKYQRVDEPKSPLLYERLIKEFDAQDSEEICNIVKDWIPEKRKKGFADSYSNGFDDALDLLHRLVK